jgi:hypothetical protein
MYKIISSVVCDHKERQLSILGIDTIPPILPPASYHDVKFVKKLYYLMHLIKNCSIFSQVKKCLIFFY